jgi:hypothetical protein
MEAKHQTIHVKVSAPETRKAQPVKTYFETDGHTYPAHKASAPEPFPSILESAEQARREWRKGCAESEKQFRLRGHPF